MRFFPKNGIYKTVQKNNDLQKFSEVFGNSGSNMVTKSSPREPPGGFALPKNIDIVKNTP